MGAQHRQSTCHARHTPCCTVGQVLPGVLGSPVLVHSLSPADKCAVLSAEAVGGVPHPQLSTAQLCLPHTLAQSQHWAGATNHSPPENSPTGALFYRAVSEGAEHRFTETQSRVICSFCLGSGPGRIVGVTALRTPWHEVCGVISHRSPEVYVRSSQC